MKPLLALLLATLPAAATAQPQDPLCADLQRAMATMMAPVSAHPPYYAVLAHCTARRVGFTNELTCTWPLAALVPSAEPLAARVQLCLPTARRLPAQPGVDGIQLGYDSYVITVAQAGAAAHLTLAIPEG